MMETANQDAQVANEGESGRRSGVFVLVSASVLAVLAVALAVAGFLVHRSASDAQAKADRLERVTAEQARTRAGAFRDLAALRAEAETAYTTLGAFMAAHQAQIESQNHAVDVANSAAALYNAHQANIVDALKTEAQVAVAAADAKATAVRNGLTDVRRALAQLAQAAG
jgi:hypothetical protein